MIPPKPYDPMLMAALATTGMCLGLVWMQAATIASLRCLGAFAPLDTCPNRRREAHGVPALPNATSAAILRRQPDVVIDLMARRLSRSAARKARPARSRQP